VVNVHVVERPAFVVLGRKTWISGQDNAQFGQFWEKCRAEGLLEQLEKLGGLRTGPQTGAVTLGVSCVAENPANRAFYYLIGIEKSPEMPECELESIPVPASSWAVFECRGKIPEALVASEIYAFSQWLPQSGYRHAHAPEMEVYPPQPAGGDPYCEFWLPITPMKG
jgi:AraC family transcriptional regulator